MSTLANNPARYHFDAMNRVEQIVAIRQLASTGMTDYGISHACGLAVEQVRQVLGNSDEPRKS